MFLSPAFSISHPSSPIPALLVLPETSRLSGWGTRIRASPARSRSLSEPFPDLRSGFAIGGCCGSAAPPPESGRGFPSLPGHPRTSSPVHPEILPGTSQDIPALPGHPGILPATSRNLPWYIPEFSPVHPRTSPCCRDTLESSPGHPRTSPHCRDTPESSPVHPNTAGTPRNASPGTARTSSSSR